MQFNDITVDYVCRNTSQSGWRVSDQGEIVFTVFDTTIATGKKLLID